MTQKQVNKFCQPTACHASRIPCMVGGILLRASPLSTAQPGQSLQLYLEIFGVDILSKTEACSLRHNQDQP